MTGLQESLEKYFGYDSFRNGQEEIVSTILSKKDVVCIQPSSSGKSLCYQMAALHLPHLTIVISPLVALMKDQVQYLKEKEISAAYLHSAQNWQAITDIYQKIQARELKLLYLTPERFASPAMQKILQHIHISMIAVDEAHCVATWGPDFRPAYLELRNNIAKTYQRPVIAAFTATATFRIQKELETILQLHEPERFAHDYHRANLFLEIRNGQDRQQHMLKFLAGRADQQGIIYVITRKQAEDLSLFLQQNGIQAMAYHAGMKNEDRDLVQDSFMAGTLPVIVATNAFGLGIHKSDIRYVIHAYFPRDIVSYIQEIGRAGRDNQPASCILYFELKDISRYRYIVQALPGGPDRKKRAMNNLDEMIRVCRGTGCIRKRLDRFFSIQSERDNCKACSGCVRRKELFANRARNERDRGIAQLKPIQYKLFQRLIRFRREIALKKNVKEFQLFSDRILKDLSIVQPDTIEKFSLIKGIGPKKIEKYVPDFLEFFRQFKADKNNAEEVSTGQTKAGKGSYLVSYQMYQSKLSIDQIALIRNLKIPTIQKHLLRAFKEGHPFMMSHFIHPDQEQHLRKLLQEPSCEIKGHMLPENMTDFHVELIRISSL